jgi:hypothetical protein
MRMRHPDQFSDSGEENENIIDRTLLEHHLATLGDRRQEVQFEHFARKLCQKVVCPNLMPHSGRDAGGDSKVDTETFPVATDLALAWFVGVPSEADAARWAFAFSTQKTWEAKVRGDVAKLVGTGRGYAKAFFVSSEIVRDKDRSAVEDELTSKHGLMVTIFDRTWLLDQVFQGKHENLAVEELGIDPIRRSSLRKGPNDTAHEARLAAAESRLQRAVQEREKGFHVAENALEAALLTRSLEKPRAEVDGMFIRAQRIADEQGTKHQRILALYQHAWAAFWWHQDSAVLNTLYGKVEALVNGTDNVYELELLQNLWNLLRTAVNGALLRAEDAQFEARTVRLKAELGRIAADANRLCASLEARTFLATISLDPRDTAAVKASFDELKEILRAAVGLVGYPLKTTAKVITELGDLGAWPGYDELFEVLVEVTSAHDGEVAAGLMLLRRGLQHLRDKKAYEAIRSFGRAFGKLYKYETRGEIAQALFFCGCAYEQLDLLWAARGSYLNAAALATRDLEVHSEVTRPQASCFRALKWIEARLGRIPHALAWHSLHKTISAALASKSPDRAALDAGEHEFDGCLAILLLRTRLEDLPSIARLPDNLNEVWLPGAAAALLFALGHDDVAAEALSIEERSPESVTTFFKRFLEQPAAADLPRAPLLLADGSAAFSSQILGCRVSCLTANSDRCVLLAESLLAMLESLLATAFSDGVFAREPVLFIEIGEDVLPDGETIQSTFSEVDGHPKLTIRCGAFDVLAMPKDLQLRLRTAISDLISQILVHTFFMADPEKTLAKILGEERAKERAVNYTGSFVVLTNILGDCEMLSLAFWTGRGAEYLLRRRKAWHEGLSIIEPKPTKEASAADGKENGPPNPEDAHHAQIEAIAPIRMELWDKAKWLGTLFGASPILNEPPIIAPIFRNREAAERIFASWRADYGTVDARNALRVSIVRGINASNPHSYRIALSANPALSAGNKTRFMTMMARLNTMAPQSSENLEMFLSRLTRLRRYFLAPAVIEGTPPNPEILFEYAIEKTEISVREAWQVGRHDLDMMAISGDDDPIIPDGETNPPVAELLQWKRSRKQ